MTKKPSTNQSRKPTQKEQAKPRPTSLRFTPTAWAKLHFLRDYGETEVGGFGIAAADDLLLIEDIQLVDQICTWTHVAFDDPSVADFFDEQVDRGRQIEQFGRVWVHTHPGNCPRPSSTDEKTFEAAFGRSDWALMFILARGGQSFARIRFNIGPGAECELPVEIDYSQAFEGCDFEQWEEEYLAHVRCLREKRHVSPEPDAMLLPATEQELLDQWYESWIEYTEAPDEMEGFVI